MGETTKISTRIAVGVGTAALCAGAVLLFTDSADAARTEPGAVAESPTAVPVACPAGGLDFGPARAGVAETMVPDTPLFAEVCRYDRPGGEAEPVPPHLASSGRLEGAALDAVVDALNAAGPTNPRRCGAPMALSAATITWATFHYSDGPPVQVYWSGPCNQSHNGTKLADGIAHEIPPYWTNPVPLQVN
ncbi:hypothetical protein LCL87_19465 [Rhodococcus hoagii]|nr:hypothetical protein [Prescottella equi]